MIPSHLTPSHECPIIGAFKVNKPWTHHNQNFECAAWWRDETTLEGVYPVRLVRNYLSPHELHAEVRVNAKVTNDYFPGLWGGVAINPEPYKPKYIGQDATVIVRGDLVDAISRTGGTPDDDTNWYIDPAWWELLVQDAIVNLKESYRRLPQFWEEWQNLNPETYQPPDISGSRWTFDNEYQSRVSMVAHMGRDIERWARRIEKIRRAQGYEKDHFFHQMHLKNWDWAKVIDITKPK